MRLLMIHMQKFHLYAALISTSCPKFLFFALCLGLIDVLSVNQHAEIFASILFCRVSQACMCTKVRVTRASPFFSSFNQ